MALAHPLPAGMRDVLPDEARDLSLLSARVMECFALRGYQRVEVPAFEYADVLEQGLGALDPHEAVRFVEPETGEVVALRPDMTLQVTRLVATRLRDAPTPARLCYQGSVVRRRHERSRRHKQFYQAGIELVGARAIDGDLEVLEVACDAMRASGLKDFVLDLGHARIAGSLIDLVAPESRPGLVEALGLKDEAVLATRAAEAGLAGQSLSALVALPTLHGAPTILARGRTVLAGTPAEPALTELERTCRLVIEGRLANRIVVDLGEVWNFAYYSGIMFQLLAEGPGEPVGSGGRYDGLYERFGVPRPAAGFGLDLGHLAWARAKLGHAEAAPLRVLVAGDDHHHRSLGCELRAAGVCAATALGAVALGYAQAWCYSHIVRSDGSGWTLQAMPRADRCSETVTGMGTPSLVAILARLSTGRR